MTNPNRIYIAMREDVLISLERVMIGVASDLETARVMCHDDRFDLRAGLEEYNEHNSMVLHGIVWRVFEAELNKPGLGVWVWERTGPV